MLFVVAFLPLAFFAAKGILSLVRTPERPPIVFLLSGLLFFIAGLAIVFSMQTEIRTGVIDFSSHRYGKGRAEALMEPLKFWGSILAFYAIGVMCSAFGLAGLGFYLGKGRK